MLNLHETFYKLSADPFRLNPDHRFVLEHPSYAQSKSYMEYALHRGEGFIVITGSAGTGKTTLINQIRAQLDRTSIPVATLTSSHLESRDLLHMLAASFGLRLRQMEKASLLLGLEEFLRQQSQRRRSAVLIVDEAQGLSPGALEELRLLANLQFDNRLLLQIFLVGQEPLRELVDRPEMDHLRQRIVAASHLDPLKPDETVDYVEHRLTRVGWRGDPEIDAEALKLIHRFSGGIPRRINLICSRLFLYGSMEKKHVLVGADVEHVLEGLRREHLLTPVAEPVNEEVGMPAEEVIGEPIVGLPRDKKADDDSGSASKHDTQDQTWEAQATHVIERGNADIGQSQVRDEGGLEDASINVATMSKGSAGAVGDFNAEPLHGYDHSGRNRTHGTVPIRMARMRLLATARSEGMAAPSDEPPDSRIQSTRPTPGGNIDAVTDRYPRRAWSNTGGRFNARRVKVMVLALLVGFVIVLLVVTGAVGYTAPISGG